MMPVETYRVTVEVEATNRTDAINTCTIRGLGVLSVAKKRKPRKKWHVQYQGKYEPDHWHYDFNGIWDSKASCLRSLESIRDDHYAHDPKDYTIVEGEPHGEEK